MWDTDLRPYTGSVETQHQSGTPICVSKRVHAHTHINTKKHAHQPGTPICVSNLLQAQNKLGHRFASVNECTYIHTKTPHQFGTPICVSKRVNVHTHRSTKTHAHQSGTPICVSKLLPAQNKLGHRFTREDVARDDLRQ